MSKSNIALVLTGGGARGAYQAGVLKYIGENISGASCNILVGTSAGAINVAGVASGKGDLSYAGPRIADLWSSLNMKQVFRTDFFSLSRIAACWLYDLTIGGFLGRPLAHSLLDTSPLRHLLTNVFRPEKVKEALDEGSIRSLAISATEVHSGSLVTFVQSNDARPWQRAKKRSVNTEITVEHIMASSAIPLLFPSVLINKRQYVDGSIRMFTPLGPATRLGAQKILAVGVRRYYMRESGNQFEFPPAKPEPNPNVAQVSALVMNSLFAESLDSDIDHLERLNSLVPDQRESSFGMQKIEVMAIRPSEDLGQMATFFVNRAPLFVRYLLRGLGSERGDSSDILSYLLFVPEFLSTLVDLGYSDARAEHDKLCEFFEVNEQSEKKEAGNPV